MRLLGLATLTAITLLTVGACGDSEDGGPGGDGDGDDGNSIDLGDGDGDSLANPATDKGGTRPITEEEAEQLEGGACAGWAAEPEPYPSSIMMVVDISSSMNDTTPATGGQTKWEVTRDALQEAVETLPGTLTVGMVMYPNKDTSAARTEEFKDASECVNDDEIVPFNLLGDADSGHRTLIDNALENAFLFSSTPTHDAYFTALEEVKAANIPGNPFMLLITDGQPTLSRGCIGEPDLTPSRDPQPIIDEIAAAKADGISTFLIGSPGSEQNVGSGDDARWWLSEAAEAGGTSAGGDCSHSGVPYCHFDMVEEDDFSASLRGALANIAGQVLDCDYTLPEPPAGQELDLRNINIVLTAPDSGDQTLVLRDAAGEGCDEGWYLSQNRVHLCEETCDEVLATTGTSLKIHFGCEPLPVEPPR